MTLRHIQPFLLVMALAVVTAGCSKAPEDDASASSPTKTAAPSTTQGKGPDAVANDRTKVINNVNEAKPGESFRLGPKDPNDPHFKQGPGIGGGG